MNAESTIQPRPRQLTIGRLMMVILAMALGAAFARAILDAGGALPIACLFLAALLSGFAQFIRILKRN